MKRSCDLEKIINKSSLILISTPNCNVCLAIKEKLKRFEKEFIKLNFFEVDINECKEAISFFNAFSAPLILVYFDRKEFIREGRNVSLELLFEKIKKLYKLYYG